MKFAPKVARKSQGCTCDAVKEHILQEMQVKLVNGKDIADDLRKGSNDRISDEKPKRHKAAKIEMTGEKNAVNVAEAAEERRIDQDGLDIECRVRLEKHTKKEKTYKENKCKAFTIMCNYCN